MFTDHIPLIFVLDSKTERSPRQTRHLEYIAQFTNKIIHVKGKDNVAGTLYRIQETRDINLQILQTLQLNDEELKNIIETDKSKFCMKLVWRS